MGSWHVILSAALWKALANDLTYNIQLQPIKYGFKLFLQLTYLAANYGMPNYCIQGGVGIQAGNMEDIGMVVEMESLYLQCVYIAYANMYTLKMWEWLGARLTSSWYINLYDIT